MKPIMLMACRLELLFEDEIEIMKLVKNEWQSNIESSAWQECRTLVL
jgi:hypothetical protein